MQGLHRGVLDQEAMKLFLELLAQVGEEGGLHAGVTSWGA